MIFISPTKYTKRLLGLSWMNSHLYKGDKLYDHASNFKLFFVNLYTNRKVYAWLSSDFGLVFRLYDDPRALPGGYYNFMATRRECIIGIGKTLEEAIEFGDEHNAVFSKFKHIEPTFDNFSRYRLVI